MHWTAVLAALRERRSRLQRSRAQKRRVVFDDMYSKETHKNDAIYRQLFGSRIAL